MSKYKKKGSSSREAQLDFYLVLVLEGPGAGERRMGGKVAQAGGTTGPLCFSPSHPSISFPIPTLTQFASVCQREGGEAKV